MIKQPWPIRFKPGQRQKCWEKNCVALGLAGSFIEPLESTTIHLIQRGIVHLLRMFPQVIAQPTIDQYNAQLDEELQHVRDFVVLHYHLTNRRDTPYWREIAEMELPATLQHRIDLFRETGTRVPRARRTVRRELLDPGDDGPGHRAAAVPPDRRRDEPSRT